MVQTTKFARRVDDYEHCGLEISLQKPEYLVIGARDKNFDLNDSFIKTVQNLKNLDAYLTNFQNMKEIYKIKQIKEEEPSAELRIVQWWNTTKY